MEEFTKGFLWEGATADFQYEGGKRFEVFVKQGQSVKTGDLLVKVDLKKIKEKYDMTTMLVIADPNGKEISFIDCTTVKKGQVIGK